MEFIKFDNNDRGSQSGFGGTHPYGPEEDLFNTKVYYCYYEPGEESTEDLGLGKKVLTKVHVLALFFPYYLIITCQKNDYSSNSG